MFNTCNFSRRIGTSCSIYLLLCLIFLFLHHFLITTHFFSSIIVTHRWSLNASHFSFQISFYLWHINTLIYLSGDIETNPGPISNYVHGLKICHWNLNSIETDNFVKIPLLEAYAITHNFDVVCLHETFLDSSHANDDPRLQLSRYSLVRADNHMGTKRGGVCIYYKEYISLI